MTDQLQQLETKGGGERERQKERETQRERNNQILPENCC